MNNVSSGEIVPYYSENSESEDSFGLQVLAEPWPVTHNLAFESSMRNRILAMENNHSIFLLDKERGVYWNEIKTVLDQAPSQEEYNRLLEFENRDLQIREKKDECYSLFIKVLSEHPDLLENAQYTSPTEAIISYFENTREELETEEVLSPADTDKAEMRIYAKIVKDINQNGPQSYYIKKILGYFDKDGGASVAYNVNPVADQFQRAFQTSTFCNRLYSFFNKRWFFDQVLNDFLVRSFLRFGYEVSFEALDKGAIEILGPYGISYTFRRLAERISQLQSGFVVRRVRYDPWPPAWWGRLLRCGEDIRGSCEWRFPCGEPDEGRPSRPVRRAGISRPYYHYAFAMLLGSTLFVTFSLAAGSGVGVGLADPRTRHRRKASKSTTRTQACPYSDLELEAIGESQLHIRPSPASSFY
ncbi:hypothetical protein Q3G72_021875 [Acer saccharum]|nr:hypothetical protein Q3G72_026086 [Acer saccharum]KAK1568218.1 hypothetical protein Q3G72_021875 [Acer saccharum]